MKKFYLAAIVTLIYVPAVTIVAELVKPLKDFLAKTFWHHWLGKGVVLILLYGLCVLIFTRLKDERTQDEKYLLWILWLAVAGALAILGFFGYEYFSHIA